MVTALLINILTNQQFNLSQTATIIGRASTSNIILKDILVSREHAVVHYLDGSYFIEDNGSRNGTLHNELPIQQRTALKSGDHLRIGSTWFSFQVQTTPLPTVKSAQLKAQPAALKQPGAHCGIDALINRLARRKVAALNSAKR